MLCARDCTDMVACNGVTRKPNLQRMKITMEYRLWNGPLVWWITITCLNVMMISWHGDSFGIFRLKFNFLSGLSLGQTVDNEKGPAGDVPVSIWGITDLYFVRPHYGDVIMGAIACQITSLTIVYSTVYSDADQKIHQSSASLAFVRGIHRGPVNSRSNGQ